MNTDTPRTDREAVTITKEHWGVSGNESREFVDADFARQLERELKDMKRELEEATGNAAETARNNIALRAHNTAQPNKEKELRECLGLFMRAGNLVPKMGGGFEVTGWNVPRLNGAAERAAALLATPPAAPRTEGTKGDRQ